MKNILSILFSMSKICVHPILQMKIVACCLILLFGAAGALSGYFQFSFSFVGLYK